MNDFNITCNDVNIMGKFLSRERMCHLLIQQFKGLVKDDKIRGSLQLSYYTQYI